MDQSGSPAPVRMATPAVSAVDAASGAANELQPQPLARPMDWHGPVPSETESVGSLSPRTTEPDSDMSWASLHVLRNRWSRPQPVDSWTLYFWGTDVRIEHVSASGVTPCGRTPDPGWRVPAWRPLLRCEARHPLVRPSFAEAFQLLRGPLSRRLPRCGPPLRMTYARQRLSAGMDSMGYEIMRNGRRIVYFQVFLHGSQLRLVGVNGCVIWRREIPIGDVYTSEEFRRDVQVYFNFPAVSFEMAQGTYPSFAETTEASLGILRAICERDQEFSNEPASGGG